MNTTHYFRSLLTAVAVLFAGLTAQAQFKGEVTQYPTSDYSNSPAEFSLAEVATALGTDVATLAEQFNTWQDAEEWQGDNLFWLIAPDGTATDNPSADGKGFWMTKDGQRIDYGDESVWFAFGQADADAGTFAICCGQMPNVLQAGEVCSAKFELRLGGKTATFEVTFNVVAKPEYNIPEPTLITGSLTIVDDVVVDVSQRPRSNYNADEVAIDLNEAIAKLGITDKALVADELAKLLYTTDIYLNDEAVEVKSDTLTNETSANGIGFWFNAIKDADDNATGEVARHGYGENVSKFYIEGLAFNATTGTLTGNLGQMPNTLEGGEQWYTYLYIVYGDKAIRIRINLTLEVVELGTLADYEKAGETTIAIEQEPTTDYAAKSIRPDLEAIAAALGCGVDELELVAMKDDVEFGNSTANNGGFWFNADGYVTSHGSTSCCLYVEPSAEGNFSVLNVGQFPGYYNIGDEGSVNLYFLGGGKYYVLTVKITIIEPKVVDGDFESVAQRSFVFQQQPSDYVWGDGVDIPYDFIAESIGTDDWTLYALAVLDDEGNEPAGNARYVKNYTITEAPGFWLDKDGRNSGHGDKSVFGISVGGQQTGKISMIQMPGKCSVGETYKTTVFCVNEDNGKMVTLNITYNIVDEVIDYETVGNETINAPIATGKDLKVTLNLDQAAEALGVSVDELLSEENTYLHGMTESGYYSGGYNCDEGLMFNNQGFFDQVGVLAYFTIAQEADGVKLVTYSEEDIADDFRLSVLMCFRVGEKQYVYDVKLLSENGYATGLTNVAAQTSQSTTVYDLAGRRVSQPRQGLYIVGGKKLLVK